MVTARIDAASLRSGESGGLVIAGRDTAALRVSRDPGGLAVELRSGKDVDKDGADEPGGRVLLPEAPIWLRVRVEKDPTSSPAESSPAARFSYSLDGKVFNPLGALFRARPGVWVGARVGLFALGPVKSSSPPGFVDIDWFRIEELK